MQPVQEHDPIPPHNVRQHMPRDSVGICEKKKKREWIVVSCGQKRNNKVTKYLSFFAYCILIDTFVVVVVVVGFVAFNKALSGSTLTDKSHYQEMQHY